MASGLALMDPGNLDALAATTLGTGECLVRAAARQPDRLVLAVGGSATTDGGTGAARAAGWRFLNADGNEIGWGGGALIDLARIEPPRDAFFPQVEVLCDVDNPLLGPEGSAAVYGPQKGANTVQVQRLDKGLARLHEVVLDQLGMDMNISGGGAAGGLAAGALAFFGGTLKPGVETLMTLTGLEAKLDGADWLLTGEGSFDDQSLRGKVISGLLEMCRPRNVRVGVLAGQVQLSPEQLRAAGVDWALPVMTAGMSLEYAMAHSEELLKERAGAAAVLLTLPGEPRASGPDHS
jgi:glycerate kinase